MVLVAAAEGCNASNAAPGAGLHKKGKLGCSDLQNPELLLNHLDYLLTPKCPLSSWYMVIILGTMASGAQTFPPL